MQRTAKAAADLRRSTNEWWPQKPQRPRGGVTLRQKMRKGAGFAPKNHQKHPEMASKTEKHAIFDAKTPISWTHTPLPDKMKELNKALEAIGDKSPQPHR